MCANCETTSTSYWRRDRKTGDQLCNACGIYSSKYHRPRPRCDDIPPWETKQQHFAQVRAQLLQEGGEGAQQGQQQAQQAQQDKENTPAGASCKGVDGSRRSPLLLLSPNK
jgi:hypothetical protein